MATGFRHLKLSINYKIFTLKPNCFKSSLSRSDLNSSKRTTWSFCKVIQVDNAEFKTGASTSLIKYQPANCALQIRCMSLTNTSIEEAQKSWIVDNNNNSYLNYKDERKQHSSPMVWFQHFSQTPWPLPVLHLPHTYDSFSLPVKSYHHSMDDMLVYNSENSVPVEILTHKTQFTQFPVFSGYLEASRYYMYCHEMNEHSSLKLSDFEHYFVSTAHVMNKKVSNELPGRPSEEQLKNVYLRLSDSLPKFFVQPLDYSIFHKDIVFQNNIRGVTTNGIASYVQQMALIRIFGHLRYAHIKMEILKITHHIEDGTVRVRWRITGVSGLRALFLFWKFKLWEWKKMMEKEREWIDGFSVFSVGSDGLVYKHVCDKMMPDEEKVGAKQSDVAVKFAIILGLIPRPYEFGVNLLNSNSFIQQELPCNQP